MDRGIVAALVADATWGGELRGDVGVFELDEASVPRILARLAPHVLVITNLLSGKWFWANIAAIFLTFGARFIISEKKIWAKPAKQAKV